MIMNFIEYAADAVEYLIYADFMTRFLRVKENKSKLLFFISVFVINITITLILNQYLIYEGAWGSIRIICNIILASVFSKENRFERIFVPMILDISVILINLTILNVMSLIFKVSQADLLNDRGILRIIVLFATKFLFFIVTRLLLKLKKQEKYILSISECVLVITIFCITMFVEMEIFSVVIKYNLSTNAPSVLLSGLGLIMTNILVYLLMVTISKKNSEQTKLKIDKMQLEMYKIKLDENEKQYNEMRKIRHDMKNHLQCVSALLTDNMEKEALRYIQNMLDNKLDFGFAGVNTSNNIINIISNIKLSQCKDKNIDVCVKIGDFHIKADDMDLCIILGNLLDNAIEHCTESNGKKMLFLEILQKKGYVNIIVKNTIEKSVLENNPKLTTSKKDRTAHGLGISSVREVVKRLGGMMDLLESNGYFIADVWILSE